MASLLTIGLVSKTTGCKVQTIRYYEEVGLIPSPDRSSGNQRVYEQDHVERLRFVKHARELGFSIASIRDLLSLSDVPDQSCSAADSIARDQLVQVEQRLERLRILKLELERMIEQCDGGRIKDCRIIEVLGDHSQCATDHGTEIP
ncbi:MAG: helix-turn-helix domain-containing protein [Alphaproteobacteria bacterium]